MPPDLMDSLFPDGFGVVELSVDKFQVIFLDELIDKSFNNQPVKDVKDQWQQNLLAP